MKKKPLAVSLYSPDLESNLNFRDETSGANCLRPRNAPKDTAVRNIHLFVK
jgi:hypothetical protein